MKKVAAGDFSSKAGSDAMIEISELATSFNLMRDQVRRRTQELSRSREDYKSLFEQVPCFICVINEDFAIVRQNTRTCASLFKGGVGMHVTRYLRRLSEDARTATWTSHSQREKTRDQGALRLRM